MYTVTCNEDNKEGQLCKLHGQMTGKRLCFEFPNGITTIITKGACPNSYVHVNNFPWIYMGKKMTRYSMQPHVGNQ